MNIQILHEAQRLGMTGRLPQERSAMQHGGVSVYDHSLHVAEASVRIAEALPCKVDTTSLIRGALLHDYFLYDWHQKSPEHPWHGFRHPYTALRNARQDYTLTPREENIILRHMFPLTPIPPACREAWIVCAADKYCAAQETLSGLAEHSRRKLFSEP